MIRHATYLEMLPTPLHNFKATTEWLKNETFNHFYRPSDLLPQKPLTNKEIVQRKNDLLVKTLAVLAPIVFLIAASVGLRTPASEQSGQPKPTEPLTVKVR